MSFPLEAAAQRAGLDASRPRLMAFLKRIHARPAYKRALERGGPYSFADERSGAPQPRWRRGQLPGRARHAAHTCFSSCIAGSTRSASARSTTTRSCSAVAPALADSVACDAAAARAPSSRASRRAGCRAEPAANHIVASTRRPAQPSGESSSARVGGVDAAAFQPGAGQFQVLHEAAAVEGLARGRQAQRQQVPADHLGAGREFEAQLVVGQAATVGNGFQRQPFQPRAIGQRGLHRCARCRRHCDRSASRPGW